MNSSANLAAARPGLVDSPGLFVYTPLHMKDDDLDNFGLDTGTVRDAGAEYKAKRRVKINPKKPGAVAEKTRYAKELYLSGNGDGKPIRSVSILAEKSGCHPSTIERWLPVWRRESDARARSEIEGKGALAKIVTANDLQEYDARVEQLNAECLRLKELVPKLTPGTDVYADALKLYTATLKAWSELRGIAAHIETAVVANRELMKAAAKLMAKGEAERTERRANSFDFS